MFFDDNIASFLVYKTKRFLSWCLAYSVSMEQRILIFSMADSALRLRSEVSQNILKSNLFLIGSILGGKNCKFQQDSASIQAFHSPTAWFTQNQVTVYRLARAISPNLNLIKNHWGSNAKMCMPMVVSFVLFRKFSNT